MVNIYFVPSKYFQHQIPKLPIPTTPLLDSATVPELTLSPSLSPLPYHQEIVRILKKSEPDLWKWASSTSGRHQYFDGVRTELLKTSYRLEPASHPELAEHAAAVAQRLGIEANLTFYQANGTIVMNAMLCHLPSEAHIVFSGPILATLKGIELEAVIAHELSHFLLWEMEQGDYFTADRLLLAAANDTRASDSLSHSARRFRLYTEIFADRGSLVGCGELEAAIAALVKTETGLTEVSAASYLRQADEIFSQNATGQTKGIEHPESFIRARALRLWAEQGPELEKWLSSIIEGPLIVDELDLVGQRHMANLTRRLLAELLRPAWFQTQATLAHARAFFADFEPATSADASLATDLSSEDPATREYYAFLLLDFASVDPDLEEMPLALAQNWSQRLGIEEIFEKLVLKELGMGKRQWNKLRKEAPALLDKAEPRA